MPHSSRRRFLQLAALSGLSLPLSRLARAAVAAPLAKTSAHFLVFGDWGSALPLQKQVADAMAAYCRAAKTPVDFAVTTGDNFYPTGVTGADDPQWQTKFERIYDARAMNFPFHAVNGNHDWAKGGDPFAPIAYSARSKRWTMPGLWSRLPVAGGAGELFFLDSDVWLPQYNVAGLGEKQTVWLDAALANSSARHKFLVFHHPPFSDGAHARDKDLEIVREIVVPRCQKWNVSAVFSGHDHDLQHIQRPNMTTQFVVSGAAGASLRPRLTQDYAPFFDAGGGFAAVKLDGKSWGFEFYSAAGEKLYGWKMDAG